MGKPVTTAFISDEVHSHLYCASPSEHNIQYQDELETIPEEEEEDPQMEEKQ